MSDYTISISDELYEKALRVAQADARSVDEVIRARLAGALDEPTLDLPADERAELRALAYLSDDTLWTLLREQLPPLKQARISALLEENSLGTINAAQYQELIELVEDGQRLTLRKAETMRLLLERGYAVHLDDLQARHAGG